MHSLRSRSAAQRVRLWLGTVSWEQLLALGGSVVTQNPTFKAVLAGMAGGMVGAWAINRFYDLARESSRTQSTWPYVLGAGLGATYATWVHRRDVPLYARVPLGAAVWMGDPERTAAPPKGGQNVTEKARNAGLRFASRRLRKVAEKALFA